MQSGGHRGTAVNDSEFTTYVTPYLEVAAFPWGVGNAFLILRFRHCSEEPARYCLDGYLPRARNSLRPRHALISWHAAAGRVGRELRGICPLARRNTCVARTR